jgi:Guanylate-binding protein, N-terminal domain
METPIQFFSTGASGSELIISEDALQRIRSETRPVTVVSIIGPYRTGKSYLLNRLMGKANGFELGPTMEAKTKGIWMWIGDFPEQPRRCLVLLDVEGLSDALKSDATHDLNLFVLALLASSIFIYNTKGTIDANALDGLHLATMISEELLSNADEEGSFAQLFPDFVWAIRDHHLKLEVDGRPVTANQYLDHCLKPKKGFGPKVMLRPRN